MKWLLCVAMVLCFVHRLTGWQATTHTVTLQVQKENAFILEKNIKSNPGDIPIQKSVETQKRTDYTLRWFTTQPGIKITAAILKPYSKDHRQIRSVVSSGSTLRSPERTTVLHQEFIYIQSTSSGMCDVEHAIQKIQPNTNTKKLTVTFTMTDAL